MVVEAVGNGGERQHRRWRVGDVVEWIGVVGEVKCAVGAPWHEHEPAVGLAVEPVVVAVAGVAVPVTHQHFGRPERQETVEVDDLAQRRQSGLGRVAQGCDHGVDVGPIVGVFVGLLLECAAELRREVADRAFVQVALRTPEVMQQERGLEFLHVHVQPEIGAVHRHGGEVAARRWVAGRGEHSVGQARVDHRGVLNAVVQGHPVHAPWQGLIVDVLVEAEFEGRLGGALGTDETLLAHAYICVRLAVDGHRGAEPRVDAGEGPREAVFLDLREHVRDGACLVTQGVPIGPGDLDADVEHMIEGEIGVTRLSLGVELRWCWWTGGRSVSVGGERRGRGHTVVGRAGAAGRNHCRHEHSDQATRAPSR